MSLLLALILSTQVMAQTPKESIRNSFLQRLTLRETVTSETASQVKKQLAEARDREALWGEELNNNQNIGLKDKSPRAFDESNTLLNPAFSSLEFKSGDIILLRGTSIISTSIAAMADSESQFSHILMIYVHPESKQVLAVESLVDKNLIYHPLEEALSEGVPRMVLYRYPDANIATLAAQKAYEAALKNIPYDFKLKIDDNYDQLYCAEVARMAFDLATQGKVKLPDHPTTVGGKFGKTIISLKLNFKPMNVFAPVDIDSTSKVKLVAEWTDYRATLNYRIKDQILLKLFQWIEEDSVVFEYSKLLPKKKQGDEKSFDLAKLQEFSIKADNIVNTLAAKMLLVNTQHVKQTGKNMSSAEIADYIESIRYSSKLMDVLKKNRFIINKDCIPKLRNVANP